MIKKRERERKESGRKTAVSGAAYCALVETLETRVIRLSHLSRSNGAQAARRTQTRGEEKEGVKPTLVDRFEGGLLLRMVSYIAHP